MCVFEYQTASLSRMIAVKTVEYCAHLKCAFVNLHGPYHYLVFFASHTCFNQSEHLCKLVSKRAGRKSSACFFWAYEKETAIITSAQSGLSLFWSEAPVFEPRSRRNLLNRKRGSIAYSLSLSTVHCPDMAKILLKGTRKRKLSIYLDQK